MNYWIYLPTGDIIRYPVAAVLQGNPDYAGPMSLTQAQAITTPVQSPAWIDDPALGNNNISRGIRAFVRSRGK